ncbi:MAG: hypothetical protein GY791_20695 [Alphaproteobacteria bacterium]|nr:hypothetical protein [Alphaproteobacteria bacterium]
MLRQFVYGRLAGYEDVNDADRLGRDSAMRWIVGGKADSRGRGSTSQMGRFETELLATDTNLAAVTSLSGQWIDRVQVRRLPRASRTRSGFPPTSRESSTWESQPNWNGQDFVLDDAVFRAMGLERYVFTSNQFCCDLRAAAREAPSETRCRSIG